MRRRLQKRKLRWLLIRGIGENDYSVTSTSAGTKMQMTQRDIPQSVTIVSQQRMEDQQLQT
ncbi:hypothetical protein E2K61_20975, partial [Escherichia coli]